MAEDTVRSLDLVGISEIAERAGVTTSAVSNWVKRHDSFPVPVARLKCGLIFSWPDVWAWTRQRNAQ